MQEILVQSYVSSWLFIGEEHGIFKTSVETSKSKHFNSTDKTLPVGYSLYNLLR